FVWMEMEAAGNPQAVALSWKNMPFLPAPAYALDIVQWPDAVDGQEAPPRLNVWWLSDQLAEAVPFKESQGRTLAERYANSEVNQVRVEAVEFDDTREQSSGKRRPCLVIRLSHPPGKPALARLRGREDDEMEFRVYRKANQTTTIVWGVGSEQL